MGRWLHEGSSFVSISEIRHSDQNQLGEEKVCFVYTSALQSLIKQIQGRNTETKAETMEKCLLVIGLLPGTDVSTFFIKPRSIFPRNTVPTVAKLFFVNCQSRKCPIDMPTGQPNESYSSAEVPCSQGTLVYVKLTKLANAMDKTTLGQHKYLNLKLQNLRKNPNVTIYARNPSSGELKHSGPGRVLVNYPSQKGELPVQCRILS